MYLISADGYKKKTWMNMKNVDNSLDVKNISDLVLKEMFGIYKSKKPYK